MAMDGVQSHQTKRRIAFVGLKQLTGPFAKESCLELLNLPAGALVYIFRKHYTDGMDDISSCR